MEFCTCFDLNKKGLSTPEISKQLIANDAALYGADILGANAGTAEQWASQIVAAPGNWYFLCNDTDIVGNWSYTYLSPDEEESVKNGTFAGDDFSLDSVNYPLTAPDREVVIYILNISFTTCSVGVYIESALGRQSVFLECIECVLCVMRPIVYKE